MYDLVILGAGPAGLAAAIYAARAELSFLVMEKEFLSGGQIMNTSEVDNYPGCFPTGGYELAEKFRAHAEALGAEFVQKHAVRLEEADGAKRVICEDGTSYETKTVLLAGGAKHRRLGVPGEERLLGRGVSYCATCDGAFFRKREVVVVGGGDVAAEDALFLSRICSKVYLVHRRDTFRAAKALVSRLEEQSNVELIYDSVVETVEGTEAVTSVVVKHLITGEERVLAAAGIFIAVGMQPQTEWLEQTVALDEAGYVRADETCRTSDPAIFAAGDIRTKQLRQVITAAADGANAITSVERYLSR